MTIRKPLTVRQAALSCVLVAVTAVVCAGLVTLAVLAAAPPAALPAIALVCVGAPIAAAYELRDAITVLGGAHLQRQSRRHISRLRQELDRLPETQHPLGL